MKITEPHDKTKEAKIEGISMLAARIESDLVFPGWMTYDINQLAKELKEEIRREK